MNRAGFVVAAVISLALLAAAPAFARDAAVAAAQQQLKRSLGPEGVVDVDRSTGTPRAVLRLGASLTAPRRAAAERIALDFVHAHRLAFGLRPGALRSLRLVRSTRGRNGVRLLVWAQTYRGIAAFRNEIRAAVTRDGRLLWIGGSPRRALRPNTTVPRLTARAAVAVAAQTRGSIALHPSTDGFRPRLVLFGRRGRMRLAWGVVAAVSSTDVEAAVVDAVNGRVLWRTNLVRKAAQGNAWEYYPSSLLPAAASTPTLKTFATGWTSGSGALSGNNAHVYSDVDDDDHPDSASANCPECGDVPASGAGPVWDYAFTAQHGFYGVCSVEFPCSWDSNFDHDPTAPAYNWHTNLRQNATQVFYYVNAFHDHLAAAPIGFSDAEGAFDVPSDPHLASDPLLAEVDDGAAVDAGWPDGNHIDNANMFTPPDGEQPRMQMYLFVGGSIIPDESPTDSNGGDEADVVYHEYTHGLSSRLITDAFGLEALDYKQSGAMGEAWSDWYAMDYLVAQGYQPDTSASGEVAVGRFLTRRADIVRTEPIDCPVTDGTDPGGCPGTVPFGGSIVGGYTYADFGEICGSPEVHCDGEIWGQTLWDVRVALGSQKAERLITDGMRLTPPEPSFLDARNAILQADLVDFASADKDTLWQIFARRGMGFDATTIDGDDIAPHAGFALPPVSTPPPPPPSPPPSPPPPPPACLVPDVTGLTVPAAESALGGAHCVLGGVRQVFSATVAKSRIISQDVPAGAQLVNGSAVSVVVSLGPKPKPKKVVLCYRHHTVKVTKAKAKQLRKHGAKLGACRRAKKKH